MRFVSVHRLLDFDQRRINIRQLRRERLTDLMQRFRGMGAELLNSISNFSKFAVDSFLLFLSSSNSGLDFQWRCELFLCHRHPDCYGGRLQTNSFGPHRFQPHLELRNAWSLPRSSISFCELVAFAFPRSDLAVFC